MTTPPPYGSNPGQPGYPNQPGYPQQPGYPAPGFPGGYPAPVLARPGMATAAAVLGFIIAGLGILFGLLALFALSTLNVGGFYAVIVVIQLVADAVLIWGGVQLLNGKDSRILTIVSALLVLLSLVGMIMYFAPSSLLSLVIPILILVFSINPAVKAWVRSKGGQTF